VFQRILQLAFRGRLVGFDLVAWPTAVDLASQFSMGGGAVGSCSHYIPTQMPDCVAEEIGGVSREVC
jgi:hypothetical protein